LRHRAHLAPIDSGGRRDIVLGQAPKLFLHTLLKDT
jgi:hypothetical protein